MQNNISIKGHDFVFVNELNIGYCIYKCLNCGMHIIINTLEPNDINSIIVERRNGKLIGLTIVTNEKLLTCEEIIIREIIE